MSLAAPGNVCGYQVCSSGVARCWREWPGISGPGPGSGTGRQGQGKSQLRSTEGGLTEQVEALLLAPRILEGVSGLLPAHEGSRCVELSCPRRPGWWRAGKTPVECPPPQDCSHPSCLSWPLPTCQGHKTTGEDPPKLLPSTELHAGTRMPLPSPLVNELLTI